MSGPAMPQPSKDTLARRAEIVADLRAIVPGEGVVDAVNEMRAFETDGLTAYRQLPMVVVLPQTVDQVRLFGGAVRWFAEPGVPDASARHTWRSLAARAIAEASTVVSGGTRYTVSPSNSLGIPSRPREMIGPNAASSRLVSVTATPEA